MQLQKKQSDLQRENNFSPHTSEESSDTTAQGQITTNDKENSES